MYSLRLRLHPTAPIPGPLRGNEIGSFAEKTVTVRMKETVRRVIAENDFTREHVARLEALLNDLPDGTIRPFRDKSAPDVKEWNAYAVPYLGQRWLDVPWFFAETYFFRRILEATGYFESGPGKGVDPFGYQKRQGLEVSRGDIGVLARRLDEACATDRWDPDALAILLHADLWGNQADLNLWPAGEEGGPRHADAEAEKLHLLADDTANVLAYLSDMTPRPVRVDVIVDNAGFELVCDLALADYLLTSQAAQTINLHVKPHPTFVSDATIEDVEQTITFLLSEGDGCVWQFGARLQEHVQEGRLVLHEDPYWTSPLSGWEMPDLLRQELARADLLVSKGDANYRRLLGDRHWDYDMPFAEIVSYLPAPLVALRTLKSEVAAGIEPARLDRLHELDPEWLTNGKWGVIQFVAPRRNGEFTG